MNRSVLLCVLALAGCHGASTDNGSGPIPGDGTAYQAFVSKALPVLRAQCAPCHAGARFGFASVTGDDAADYAKFFPMLSLDQPAQSRLLAKILPASDPNSIAHAGGARVSGTGDPNYQQLMQWVNAEVAEKCAGGCGMGAPRQWVAYVQQPDFFWSTSKIPSRTDWGIRSGARIMLQKVQPGGALIAPTADAAVDFLLGSGFCENGDCDFGNLSVSYQGTQMAFECRMQVAGESYVERSWNICIAGVDLATGKSINPHRLMSAPNYGYTYARATPLAIACFARQTSYPFACNNYGPDPNGLSFALGGFYDRHGMFRQRHDLTPVFTPDGTRVIFASMRPDPRSGEDSVQSYHGNTHLLNLVSAALDGSDLRTLYRNEGGVADLPFFLKNGNLAFHVWLLDRTDRHMYLQSSADGMVELPTLMGHTQGPNMWGKATQLNDGLILGLTGNRRGAANNVQPFIADHTLGSNLDPSFVSEKQIGPDVLGQFQAFPNSYCTSPPDGPNCSTSQYFADANWSPDGRALVVQNTSKTYMGNFNDNQNEDGESFYTTYNSLDPLNYLPQDMGISMIDKSGAVQVFIANPAGTILRYPVWVGRRQPPTPQSAVTNEAAHTATLHIADFKIWLGLQQNAPDKTSDMQSLAGIKSVRVLYKEMSGNACLSDGATRDMTNTGFDFDHPVAMGANNASGFIKYDVPVAAGGDGHGDIPLKADNSVLLTIPSGRMLYFQGVDQNGFVVAQRSHLFSLPPRPAGAANIINTSVPTAQYDSQCIACHGSIDGSSYVGLAAFGNQALVPLDFTRTQAYQALPVDLSSAAVGIRTMTFKDQLRPILDAKCVSCHQGENPAGEFSL
ncbi:MAG TPA: hypothetical protein VHE37_02705, partial [Nevskiaceae bacterium]|nr:hypothetical protein [Nevskiaceae bacterium]